MTLTAANHVIHLSRWWNPAVEDQATDRAYRIGQTRDVTVYLPQLIHPDPDVAPSSFDLKLHALMERKRRLSRGLLASGDDEADTGALFDSVVLENVVPGSKIAAQEPDAPPVAASPPPSRRVLGLRPKPAEPVATRSLSPRPVWLRRIVYEANASRDLTIFKAPIANDPVQKLMIIDPYGIAGDRARKSMIDFMTMMIGDGVSVECIRLIAFDADSVELTRPETSEFQYTDFRERWSARFGNSSRLQIVQRSKRQNPNLHDREVRATTQSGRTLIWDLGRGVDGVIERTR